MRQTKAPVGVQLCITSRCNRRCPDCIAGVGYKSEGYDVDWKTIVQLGELMGFQRGGPLQTYESQDIGWNITGGEPSFHKDFVEFAPRFRDVLKCDRLIITSNGYGFRKFPEAFLNFDEIHCSIYGDWTYQGCPPNTEDIEFMRAWLKGRPKAPSFHATPIHHSKRPPPGPGSCWVGTAGYVTYWEGKLYPCCAAMGAEGGYGIEPDAEWRDKIMTVDLPCSRCIYRV